MFPPQQVLENTYLDEAGELINKHLTAKILKEGDLTGRHSVLFNQVELNDVDLEGAVREGLDEMPEHRWDVPIRSIADKVALKLVEEEKI